MLDELKNWFSKNKEKIFEDYFEFLRFKTISADKSFEKEMINCASWLNSYLENTGMDSEVIQTKSYPLVFASKIVDEKYPTLLVYGHYDVQPIEPLNEWLSDPFEPIIKEDSVYARGASDNKGQIFYAITAINALISEKKDLKVNIKFIIDGEEESASDGLLGAMDDLKDKLKADYLLVVDMSMPDINTPAITLGARGLSALTCEFIGSSIDLHSGEHGGLAYNPLRATTEVLSKLFSEDGKINIKEFYSEVEEVSSEELKNYDLEFDETQYKKTFGIVDLGGEKKYRGLVANWFRPTLEINGIGGGYFEKNFKTVIPAKVTVKISCRLVPNQNPEKIAKIIKDFLEKNTPKEIDIKVEYEKGGLAIRSDSSSLLAKTAKEAYAEVFKKPCKKILAGGSVPIIGNLVKLLNCDVVLMGTALMDDNIHAPNEHFGLDRFEKGFLTCARLFFNLKEDK